MPWYIELPCRMEERSTWTRTRPIPSGTSNAEPSDRRPATGSRPSKEPGCNENQIVSAVVVDPPGCTDDPLAARPRHLGSRARTDDRDKMLAMVVRAVVLFLVTFGLA